MKLSRRHVIVSGAALASNLSVSARALGTVGANVIVFDSGSKPSCAWAATRTGPTIDVAQGCHQLWSALRDIPAGCTVVGSTRWSDFLVVRGQLQSSGLRLRHFTQNHGIVEWELRK